MANPLQQASVRRKAIYFGLILGLFTVSLFWRGKFDADGKTNYFRIPLSDPDRVAALNEVRRGSLDAGQVPAARSPVHAAADWLQARQIGEAAKETALDLRELDKGDPQLAAGVARLSLVGSRGFVITAMWRAAIEKQKRNEWEELELLVRTVTQLQPNFITPWIYQSWNISYNVSVENDRLNDMYFYIARGIELLAEGERRNRNSPDMRFQLGFYYQNKFSVSDKVTTLRSLGQLSAIKHADRDPKRFEAAGGAIDMAAFRDFAAKYPQLVRRLREKLGYTRPEQVVRFLADNTDIPSRFDREKNDRLKPPAEQFPVLPNPQTEADRARMPATEFTPRSETDDGFDMFHAARAWYEYSLLAVPPADPEPSGLPKLTGADRFLYRIPKAPMLIIFRQHAPRAQTYLAERLTAEGWFDRNTQWNPDERADTDDQLWFPRGESRGLPAVLNSQTEWAKAHERWRRHGEENGLSLSPAQYANYQRDAGNMAAPFGLGMLDMTDDQLAAAGTTRKQVAARAKLLFYDQNKSVTNFDYFRDSSEAEASDALVAAHRLLWDADKARDAGDKAKAIGLYVQGVHAWRQAMLQFPKYHRNDRTQKAEETLLEAQLALAGLLKGDRGTELKAERAAAAVRAVLPAAPAELQDDLARAAAEREALTRVVRLDPRVELRANEILRLNHEQRNSQEKAYPAVLKGKDALLTEVAEKDFGWLAEYTDRNLRDDTTRWVTAGTETTTRERLGLVRRPPPAAAEDAPQGVPNDMQRPNQPPTP